MHPGEQVYVQDFFGEMLLRTVVELDETHVFVCNGKEWVNARREGRTPSSVGFQLQFVSGVNK